MTQTSPVKLGGAEPESESDPSYLLDFGAGAGAAAAASKGTLECGGKENDANVGGGAPGTVCCAGGVFGRVDKFLTDQVKFD